jgi:hypothetical protein
MEIFHPQISFPSIISKFPGIFPNLEVSSPPVPAASVVLLVGIASATSGGMDEDTKAFGSSAATIVDDCFCSVNCSGTEFRVIPSAEGDETANEEEEEEEEEEEMSFEEGGVAEDVE